MIVKWMAAATRISGPILLGLFVFYASPSIAADDIRPAGATVPAWADSVAGHEAGDRYLRENLTGTGRPVQVAQQDGQLATSGSRLARRHGPATQLPVGTATEDPAIKSLSDAIAGYVNAHGQGQDPDAFATAVGRYIDAKIAEIEASRRPAPRREAVYIDGGTTTDATGEPAPAPDLTFGQQYRSDARDSARGGAPSRAPQLAQGAAPPKKSDSGDDATGTDPRGFGAKLMPYFRYTELDNGLEVKEAVLFGMLKLDDAGRFAVTYEFPIAKEIDYSGVSAFSNLGLGSGLGGGGGLPSGGVPPGGLEDDGDTIGIGDLNLRFLAKPKSWEWKSADGVSSSIIPLFETTFPTATEDVLGRLRVQFRIPCR
jgi:hypothetical protein